MESRLLDDLDGCEPTLEVSPPSYPTSKEGQTDEGNQAGDGPQLEELETPHTPEVVSLTSSLGEEDAGLPEGLDGLQVRTQAKPYTWGGRSGFRRSLRGAMVLVLMTTTIWLVVSQRAARDAKKGLRREIDVLVQVDQAILYDLRLLERRVDTLGGGWRRRREAWEDDTPGWSTPWAWPGLLRPVSRPTPENSWPTLPDRPRDPVGFPSPPLTPPSTSTGSSTPPSSTEPDSDRPAPLTERVLPPLRGTPTSRPKTASSTTRSRPPTPTSQGPPTARRPSASTTTTATTSTTGTSTARTRPAPKTRVSHGWTDQDLEHAWGEGEPRKAYTHAGAAPATPDESMEITSPVPLALTVDPPAVPNNDSTSASLGAKSWGVIVGTPLVAGFVLILGAWGGWRFKKGSWGCHATPEEERAPSAFEMEPIPQRVVGPGSRSSALLSEATPAELQALANTNYEEPRR